MNKKYNFIPVTNEDLRKHKASFSKKYDPYVRIQKPGLLVFPRKTLEYLEIDNKAGTVACLKWWVDADTKTIAFKIMKDFDAVDAKDAKVMKVVDYGPGPYGTVSITPILRKLGVEWKEPSACPLEPYVDNDPYFQIGKVYTFKVQKKAKVTESVT